MTGRFTLVADDYGLSPGVSAGIRDLIAAGRLTGTGCMTLFPEWPAEASRLKTLPTAGSSAIGQHLTLTDFPSVTGFSLDGSGRLPDLLSLIKKLAVTARHDAAILAELDRQHELFVEHWGRAPAYFDGHQHVHFLRPVRMWLKSYAERHREAGLPWLRGAPSTRYGAGFRLKAKVGFVGLIARGFDEDLRKVGFNVRGPLAGFYDWTRPEDFAAALDGWLRAVPPQAVVMCHPGHIDPVLEARDTLTAARAVELDILMRHEPICRKD